MQRHADCFAPERFACWSHLPAQTPSKCSAYLLGAAGHAEHQHAGYAVHSVHCTSAHQDCALQDAACMRYERQIAVRSGIPAAAARCPTCMLR